MIELCKNYGIHILNRRFPDDREGEITCVANEGSSIVDYFIASSNLFQYICNFEVCNYSDSVHFPLACSMKFKIIEETLTTNNVLLREFTKFKWKEIRKNTFMQNFNALFQEFKIRISVDDCLDCIVSIYQQAAECMKPKQKHNSNKHEPWRDNQCEQIKKQKYIEDIQVFGVNMSFISLSEVKKFYIS